MDRRWREEVLSTPRHCTHQQALIRVHDKGGDSTGDMSLVSVLDVRFWWSPEILTLRGVMSTAIKVSVAAVAISQAAVRLRRARPKIQEFTRGSSSFDPADSRGSGRDQQDRRHCKLGGELLFFSSRKVPANAGRQALHCSPIPSGLVFGPTPSRLSLQNCICHQHV